MRRAFINYLILSIFVFLPLFLLIKPFEVNAQDNESAEVSVKLTTECRGSEPRIFVQYTAGGASTPGKEKACRGYLFGDDSGDVAFTKDCTVNTFLGKVVENIGGKRPDEPMRSVSIVSGGTYRVGVIDAFGNDSYQYITTPQCDPRTANNTSSSEPSNIEQVFGKITPPQFIQNIGSGEKGISRIITTIINIIYAIAAIAFVFMIIWSAWQWIVSGGEKDKVAAARQRLTYAIVGIVILSVAGVIITLLGEITGFTFFN